ncbi:MAG: hypothetical protein PHY02_02935 [Phycisphaerae bacterium]|nr:hypothetical protein [Phycisphaerae bacterium]
MPLYHTAYSLASLEPMVSKCLELKRFHVHSTPGIGSVSCCACIEYLVRGQLRYTFGNSQFHNPIEPGIYTYPYVHCHGRQQ